MGVANVGSDYFLVKESAIYEEKIDSMCLGQVHNCFDVKNSCSAF